MKIKIVRRCRVRGVEFFPDAVVDTDRGIALERIGAGLAVPYVPPPKEADPDGGDGDPGADGEAGDAGAGDDGKKEKREKKEKKKKEGTPDA